MSELNALLREIERFCRQHQVAESTFGRQAVGNSKLTGRLRAGKGITLRTVDRVRAYINAHAAAMNVAADRHADEPPVTFLLPATAADGVHFERPFRFYDNRQKYLAFVYTCNEKPAIARRVEAELQHLQPAAPGLRVFDAGTGDGLVLTETLRSMHHRFPTVPFLVNGKEISDENVRLCLEKMPDRFCEHPATVLVISNLKYCEAPWLRPGDTRTAAALNWVEVPLRGHSSMDFARQIADLEATLKSGWATRRSDNTGNPLCVRPSVLVMYRQDHRLLLDRLVPGTAEPLRQYDLVLASHPWSARQSAELKVTSILAPLTHALAPGGRLFVVQGYGDDPGHEILRQVWPDAEPFTVRRHELLRVLKGALGREAALYNFSAFSDTRALFQYRMHTLPTEITENIGTSTLLAAWNAAIYVGQIDDDKLEAAIARGSYLESTRTVLRKHGGLWFNNESFVISRSRS